jgi:hypothetical protein
MTTDTPPIPSPDVLVSSTKGRMSNTWYRYFQRLADAVNNVVGGTAVSSGFGIYNVKDYGALGDGATNDTAAIQTAVDAASTAGGGTVYFPAGTYKVTNSTESYVLASGTTTSLYGIFIPSDVHVLGAGRGATTIQKYSNTEVTPFCFLSATNASIKSLTVDCEWPTKTNLGHGISDDILTLGDIGTFVIEDVEVKNVGSYAIGLENHTFQGTRVINVHCHDSGVDGIDLKNVDDLNRNNIFSDLVLENYGQRATIPGSTGIDVRGSAHLSNITCRGYGGVSADGVGIRIRGGLAASAAGLQGHECTVTNFKCVPADPTDTIGLVVNGSRNSISNGYIEGALIGVYEIPTAGDTSSDNIFSNIQVQSAGTYGFALTGTNSLITGCRVETAGTSGYYFSGTNQQATGCWAESCTTSGFHIDSGAVRCRIVGCGGITNGVDYDNQDNTSIVVWVDDTDLLIEDGGLFVRTAGNTARFINDDPGASSQVIRLEGASTTPANSDTAYASLYMRGTSTSAEVGRLSWLITDITSAAEVGRVNLSVMNTGGLINQVRWSDTLYSPETDGYVSLGAASKRWSAAYVTQGINFPTTPSMSTVANMLDTYEEGTWTPTIVASATNFSAVGYNASNYGRYTKTGRQVAIQCRMQTTSVTTTNAGGEVYISGLPYKAETISAAGWQPMALGFVSGFTAAPTAAMVISGTSNIQLFRNTSNSTMADVAGTVNTLYLSGTYVTTE